MLSRRLLRIKVVKNLYAHLKSGSTNLMASEKNLMQSVDKCYDLYFLMMSIIVDIARYAENRQELAKQKQLPTHEDLNPNRRFVDNRVVHLIAASDSINDHLAARKLSWSQQGDLIKDLYNKLIKTDLYKAYMCSPEDSFAADLKFVDRFFREILEDDEQLEATLDDMSLLWNDDLGFALIMVVRTLSGIRESTAEVKVLPKFKSDEDEEFVKQLFEKSLLQYNDNQTIIDRFTRNWDVERIAFMDNLIMSVATTELTSFPSIPVKVTLDEYIEIAKFYSTPSSGIFINGVLDKIVVELTEQGEIRKSGRGLI